MRLAKTLSAYIGRQFLGWCSAVFAAMLTIIFLLDYIELIRRGGAKADATLGVLLEMAALKLPHMAQEVLPFSILFGTMMAFWRLTRTNELVVARAAGVSVWQFLTPAVLFALVIGIVAVTVFNPVASAMQASYEALENRVLRGGGNQCARPMPMATRS
jgi:lipopolysaccharide export system permease protein